MTIARRFVHNVITAAIGFLIVFAALVALAQADAPPDAGPALVGDDLLALSDGPSEAADAPPHEPPVRVVSADIDPRDVGAPWLGVLFGVLTVLRTVKTRLEPRPGEPPAGAWATRGLAILSAAIAVGGAAVDAGTGAASWWAVVMVGGAAIALVWDAFDPPRGSKRKGVEVNRAAVAIVVGLALSACSPGPSRHVVAATSVRASATLAVDVVGDALADDVAEAVKGVDDPAERERIAAEVAAWYTAPGGPVERANALSAAGLAFVEALVAIEERRRALAGTVAP